MVMKEKIFKKIFKIFCLDKNDELRTHDATVGPKKFVVEYRNVNLISALAPAAKRPSPTAPGLIPHSFPKTRRKEPVTLRVQQPSTNAKSHAGGVTHHVYIIQPDGPDGRLDSSFDLVVAKFNVVRLPTFCLPSCDDTKRKWCCRRRYVMGGRCDGTISGRTAPGMTRRATSIVLGF